MHTLYTADAQEHVKVPAFTMDAQEHGKQQQKKIILSHSGTLPDNNL